MMLWRELDARKNAVSMAARHHFSHRDLQGKSSLEMVQMLLSKGQRMEDYPTCFTRGTWLQSKIEDRPLSIDELAKIPEKHRPPVGTLIKRGSVVAINMPPFNTVSNREGVIFRREAPLVSG